MSKCYSLVLFCLLAMNLTAQPFEATSTSSVLSSRDTVYITIGSLMDKVATHKVTEKQTLYSIAKFYGVDLSTILFYNAGINTNLIIGQTINVPIPNKAIIRYKKGINFESNHIPVSYVVNEDETLYRICRKYFKMPVDSIKVRNNLYSNNIRKGQRLHMGWLNINGIPKEIQKRKKGEFIHPDNIRFKEKYDVAKVNKRAIESKGVAVWQKNSSQKSDTYALHRIAKINSIIAVTNPMNKRTIYARVIGRIPNTVYDKDVLTVISPKVADMLGAKDPRFFVRVKYLK